MDSTQKKRKNGFERPFHPLQMASWVVFGTDCVVFAVFCLPILEETMVKIPVSIFWAISVVVLVAATARATNCDPADPHINSEGKDEVPDDDDDESQALPVCWACNSRVYKRSKHCRACAKCVHVFDHHCKWLNNCVGDYNYKAFFTSISSVVVMTGIILGVCISLFVEHLTQDTIEERFRRIYAGSPQNTCLGLLSVLIVVNLPLFVLDLQLVLLHVFLTYKQLTTFEYIMNKNEQTRLPESKYRQDDGAASKGSKRGRELVLPRCMDWIVYKRRAKKPSKSASPESSPTKTPGEEETAADAQGLDAAEADAEGGARRGSKSKKPWGGGGRTVAPAPMAPDCPAMEDDRPREDMDAVAAPAALKGDADGAHGMDAKGDLAVQQDATMAVAPHCGSRGAVTSESGDRTPPDCARA